MRMSAAFFGATATAGVLLCSACGGEGDSGGRTDADRGAPGATAGMAGSGDPASPMDFGQGPRQPTAQPMGAAAGVAPPPSGPTTPVALTPVAVDQCGTDNPAGLDAAAVQALEAGGGTPPRVLYPYDGTVFPRGLLAPTLMWDGEMAEAVYVHIRSSYFEYQGCLVPGGPNQLTLPQDVWKTAGAQTTGAGDPFSVELTPLVGGAAQGPASFQFVIAQATIAGSIYYNSYSSALGGLGGNVLRIPPGGRAEAFVSNECNGCHSVSADGSRMVSQTLATGGRSYALSPGGAANPPAMIGAPRIAFAALYPNGSHYLATYASLTVEVARANLTGTGGPPAATLYETDSGTVVPVSGVPEGAMMPTFSADGSLLAFTDLAVSDAHGLALVDYDTSTHTASGYRVLYEDTMMRPGWPFVLPDDRGVIFVRTTGLDFSGEGAGLLGLPGLGPVSDLYLADVDTGEVTVLAQAMGYRTAQDAASDTTYLPFGAEELHRNYFPTVSPVAAGGYFWVFFDAVRHYGNLGLQRQLWGTAVTIDPAGDYSVDRSHPAFYLPGQEFGTGNHRAFAALDACKADGDSCTSGIDCCGGFCSIPDDLPSEFGEPPVGKCGADMPRCAKTNERCTTSADCCPPQDGQPQNACIAGFCAFVPPLE